MLHHAVIFIIYGSLLLGLLLAKVAKEELKQMHTALVTTLKAAFVLFVLVYAFTTIHAIARTISLVFIILFMYRIHERKLHDNNYYLTYSAIGFCIATTAQPYILYTAIPACIISITTAALNAKKSISVYAKIFLVTALFYVIGLLTI